MNDKTKTKITIVKEIDDGMIENVIITALEGGINYWAITDNTTPDFEKYYKDNELATSQIAFKILKDGGTIYFGDAEEGFKEEGGSTWELTWNKLIKGITHFLSIGNVSLWDIYSDDADLIIQYAVFGEIVFG